MATLTLEALDVRIELLGGRRTQVADRITEAAARWAQWEEAEQLSLARQIRVVDARILALALGVSVGVRANRRSPF